MWMDIYKNTMQYDCRPFSRRLEVGRLTEIDIDIAIFKKPKPAPTRYL